MFIKASGKCTILDATNNQILLDSEPNAIHPLNLSVVLGRGLAGMPNSNCYRIAFGTGGTVLDGLTSSYIKNDPNINSFSSRLYNEVYSEIIDATTVGLLSTGDGAVPEHDDPPVLFQSGPGCSISVDVPNSTTIVKVTCHLNAKEPLGQNLLVDDEEIVFEFDEIGIFSNGRPSIAKPGYQYVDLDSSTTKTFAKNASSTTNLTVATPSSKYFFRIIINNGIQQLIKLDFSSLNNTPTYGQLVARINAAIMGAYGTQAATASISDGTINTFGHLKFTSSSAGDGSTISLSESQSTDTQGYQPLFVALGGSILPSKDGQNPGVALNFTDSSLEAERMICHLRFNPIKKARNTSLVVEYKIELTVLPSNEI